MVLPGGSHLRGSSGRTEPSHVRAEEVPIDGDIDGPVLWNVFFIEDRNDGTHDLARAAIHALVGMHIALPDPIVDAVDGALVHARSIVDVYAWLRDHVS